MNPIATDAIEWKYYIVYCVILVVELILVYLNFVETSGRTLEEVGDVFGEGIHDLDVQMQQLGEIPEIDAAETNTVDEKDFSNSKLFSKKLSAMKYC